MSAQRFGAWCYRPSFADIDFAAKTGITRLDIMVNNLSKEKDEQPFTVDWSTDKYINVVAHALHIARIDEVHFTSWLMPHVDFCKKAGDDLQQLCIDTGAHGVVFDAEEPWTQARNPDYYGARVALKEAMKGCRYGVTGIGWASKWVRDIAGDADYVIPQLYSTTTSKLDPHEYGGPVAHWSRWNDNLMPALAAYRTTPKVLRAAIAEVQPTDTILLWALRHLRATSGAPLRKVIIELAKEGAA